MISSREDLLMTLLNCGSLDLKLIDDVGYDWCDVLDQLDWPRGDVDFNLLMRGVVSCGIIELREAIEERIAELDGIAQDTGELDDEEGDELDALRDLDPDEDISSYHNWLDTYVYFEAHGDVYRKYLAAAIDEFEDNTGLSFS